MKRTSNKSPKWTLYALTLLAAVAALVIAGCGGGGSSSSSAEASASGGGESSTVKAGGSGSGTVDTAEVEGLGTVLVDSEGLTLYMYTVDNGTTSNCYGECASFWPPLVAKGKPTAGEGAVAADLGTTKRKDGTLQVTYKGHPLYTFVSDSAPGEAKGNEYEGTWFVLNENGAQVMGAATTGSEAEPEESEEGSGGGGYGY